MKKIKWLTVGLSALMALGLAFGLVACGPEGGTGGGGGGGDDETGDYGVSDWYILGNGAGSLNSCSWTEYVEGFRFKKTSDEKTFVLKDLTFYAGDNFKIVLRKPADTDDEPSKSDYWTGTTAHLEINSGALADKDGGFMDGALKNIEVKAGEDGVYDLKIVQTSAVLQTLYFEKKSSIEPLGVAEKYQMYVVGIIASLPNNVWPNSTGSNVAGSCLKLTMQADQKTFKSEPIDLVPSDAFKVYNVRSNSYHPGGVKNDKTGYSGKYIITYSIDKDEPSVERV